MLYFAISVVVNTISFPTIQRYIDSGVSVIQTDTSLIEILAEDLFGTTDGAIPVNDADDVSYSVDYLSFRSGWFTSNEYFVRKNERATNQGFPEIPTLEKFTPPPKV